MKNCGENNKRSERQNRVGRGVLERRWKVRKLGRMETFLGCFWASVCLWPYCIFPLPTQHCVVQPHRTAPPAPKPHTVRVWNTHWNSEHIARYFRMCPGDNQWFPRCLSFEPYVLLFILYPRCGTLPSPMEKNKSLAPQEPDQMPRLGNIDRPVLYPESLFRQN